MDATSTLPSSLTGLTVYGDMRLRPLGCLQQLQEVKLNKPDTCVHLFDGVAAPQLRIVDFSIQPCYGTQFEGVLRAICLQPSITKLTIVIS